jgi:hypothetical protein
VLFAMQAEQYYAIPRDSQSHVFREEATDLGVPLSIEPLIQIQTLANWEIIFQSQLESIKA